LNAEVLEHSLETSQSGLDFGGVNRISPLAPAMCLYGGRARAQNAASAELVQQLPSPVADLISAPIQVTTMALAGPTVSSR